MIRRRFLRHLVVGTAGLIVTDDALELLTEPRRKLWQGADMAPAYTQFCDGQTAAANTFADFTNRLFEEVWGSWVRAEQRRLVFGDGHARPIGYMPAKLP